MGLNVEISKDGYRVLKVEIDGKFKYIGSKYNHNRDLKKNVEELKDLTENDNYIIMGLVVGEHIKELYNSTSENNKILIVEYNLQLINYCKTEDSLKEILNSERVYLAKDKADIIKFFQNQINEGNINFLKINSFCNYAKLFWNEFEAYYDIIKDEILRITLNRNTVIAHGEMYLNNLLANLKNIANSSPVNVLKEKYKDKPAIIVSAGPSLSKNIDLLRNVNGVLVLSGGRTVKTLNEKGITPSFVGIVDPKEESYTLVEGEIDKVEYPMYFNDATPPKAIEQHKGKKFFSLQNTFFNLALKEEVPSLYGGGSIAHSLTNVALYMGCNPIIYIGQDLAYTNDREHDDLARSPWDSPTYTFYSREDDIYVEDVFGGKVRTSLQFNTYRKSLQSIIEKNSETKFINATEGGANISGAINKRFEDVIKELKDEKIVPITEYLIDVDNKREITTYLERTLTELENYRALCEQGRNILHKCKSTRLDNKKKFVKYEKEFYNVHTKIQSNIKEIILINAVLSKAIYEVEGKSEYAILINDNEEKRFDKQYNKANELYLKFEEVIDVSYEKIKHIIDNLK